MTEYIARYLVNGCLKPKYDFSVSNGDPKKSDALAVKIAMEHVKSLRVCVGHTHLSPVF